MASPTRTYPYPLLRTPQQVLDDFRAKGITISGWCRQHGFNRNVVNALLYRGLPGLRGESHRAAIALGLKPNPAATEAEV